MCKRPVFLLFLGLAAAAFVSAPAFAAPLDIRTANGSDDAEQHLNAGMDVGSSDIELPYEDDGTPSATDEQVAGLRFIVPLAKGTKITKAYVEFTCDETKGGTRPVNLIIEGQLAVNPPAFTTNDNDITGRAPWTSAKVSWTVENWTTVGQKSQTPNISAILQELINQNGWASGNALVLAFRDDKSKASTGIRCADAYEDSATTCALLHIEVFDPKSSAPNPADGATSVGMPLFGWTAGDGAIFHNVYVGKTATLTEADLVAKNQPFAMYYHVAGLDLDTKYYWRVDEVDATGVVTAGDVWSFTSLSVKAADPSPANGVRNAPTPAGGKLTWAPGQNAQTHTVYFGTSFDEVDKATGGTPQAATSYVPATPLVEGKIYYWRVDEFDGTTTHKGDVWSFAVSDLIARWTFDEGSGNIAHDASGRGNDGTLMGGYRWIAGIMEGGVDLTGNGYVVLDSVDDDITSTNMTLSLWIKTTQATGQGDLIALNDSASGHPFELYVSDGYPGRNDGSDVTYNTAPRLADGQWHMLTWTRDGTNAIIYVDGVQAVTYTSTFSLGSVTRWSIGQEWDNATPSDFYTGSVDDVRIYSRALTPEQIKEVMKGDALLAKKPSPANKSTVDVVKAEAGLSWTAGDDAQQHDVYFGTNQDAVASATASDTTGVYRGRQSKTSYMPTETLGWGTGPYYWRVDEIKADGTITAGPIWSFTVANFLIVDDMESYTDDEGNRIYEIWVDGWTNNTGAVVGNLTAPFAERTIVHGGAQAMPMDYNNAKTPFYSEAEQTFAPLQNWTSNGVDTLSLWVRGNPVRFVDKGNGAFTVGASGHDIWDNADDFRFIFKRLSGNGSITVKVDSLVNTNAWAKAGVMIRDSLDAGSQMAYMIQSFSSGVSFGWRQNMGLACGSATQAGIVAPQWVKLTRTGNAFTAQYSADGKTWTDIKDATTGQVVSTTIGMGANIYIGLCVTSHNTNATTIAELSGAATTGGVTGSWQQAWIGDDPDRTNGSGDVYVAVEDSAGKVAVASNATLANAAAWTEWKIPLSSLTGVNLAKVKKLYIGVGDRKNPVAGGAGRLYIDDISLTKP